MGAITVRLKNELCLPCVSGAQIGIIFFVNIVRKVRGAPVRTDWIFSDEEIILLNGLAVVNRGWPRIRNLEGSLRF